MNEQIHGEASRWLVEFRTGEVDDDMRRQFAAWLRTSPEHVTAYLQLTAFWDDAGRYDPQREIDIEALIADSAAQDNVVEFATAPDVGRAADSSPTHVSRAASKRRWVAAAAVASLVATLTMWLVFGSGSRYSTEVGEQRTLLLADGSTVKLNALSEIRVRLSEHERVIDLLSGQALFQVAKDKNRPFIVSSGDTLIRAVGTQFDVSRKSSGTVVTVVEGRVAVLSRESPARAASETVEAPRSIELGAGEQVRLTSAPVLPQPRDADVASATAWTQQLLIFESTPLPEVAEEFNRFNTRQLVVEGTALAGVNVSGTFPALDPASLPRLLSFLREQPDIEVLENDDEILVRRK